MSRHRKTHMIKKGGAMLLAITLLFTIIAPGLWSMAEDTETAIPEDVIIASEPAYEPATEQNTTPEKDPTDTQDPIPEQDPTNTQDQTGAISGFLWVDGNGSLSFDWNGFYDSGEQPLPEITVYLYDTDLQGGPITSITTPFATTVTDGDGLYTFENLDPGNYVLGLDGSCVSGVEYLLPLIRTE